jgi:tetratricopeptide (TPR) repeat protein
MSLVTQNGSKRRIKWGRLVATSALTLMIGGVVMNAAVTPAYAQEEKADEGRQFGAKAGAIVNEALQFINDEQHSAALAQLNKALALPELNAYERSTMYQMQGQAYYELNQYGPSIQAFENAISAGGLLPNESSNLRVNIAQLLIGDGQYARGAQMLEDWSRSGGNLKPQHVEYLYQAWVQAERYDRALPWAERYFNNANPKERKHFDLLNFLYNNLGMPAKQADIVKQMINRWPEDKSLWDAWASMLANGGREQEAFEVSKMLYLGGAYSNQIDLERVVQYYSYYDMPYQAAQILEREMNAGKIQQTPEKLVQLSDLLRQSREYKRAIPILEKAAASSGKAKLYADLGEALYNENQCGKAETAFKSAMERGFDRGKAWMLIANCRYDKAASQERLTCSMSDAQKAAAPWTKERKNAIAAFGNVPASSREAKNARKWKSFIAAESKAVENRCIFEANVKKERCFIAIRQAYSNEFLAGKFELGDETCVPYKAEFDTLYKQDRSDDAEN